MRIAFPRPLALLAPVVVLAACGETATAPRAVVAAAPVRLDQSPALTPGGVYYLHNACSGKLLDVEGVSTADGARVHLWTAVGGANQQWTVTPTSDGAYQLTSVNSGKALDVFGWATANGSPVGQWSPTGGANQHWRITDLGTGYAKLNPMHAMTTALDVSGAGTADGTPIQVWDDNGTCAQQWQFEAVGGSTPTPTPPPTPSAHVRTVGAGKQYQTIAAAVAAAQDGDTVRVDAGTYTNDVFDVNTRITIEGVGGFATLAATASVAKGIINTNTDVTLRRLEFTGAANGDRNGAGIRYQGGNLVIEDSYFHDNQDGLLAATDTAGTIRITHSEFAHNGAGDGRSHNVYINDVKQFTFDRSYSHDAVVGHELKSRAENTTITNSRLFDLGGSASYDINVPNGGNLTVTGNVIEQGPNTQNPYILSYGDEGLLRAGRTVTVSGNTVVNHLTARAPGGILNPNGVAMTVTNNTLYGLSVAQFVNGRVRNSVYFGTGSAGLSTAARA